MTEPAVELVERLAVVESRQEDDRLELRRVRDKVHELVGSLAAIAGLTAELRRVHEDVGGIRAEIPNIARQAAREAALELSAAATADERESSRLTWQKITAAAAIVGLVVVNLVGVNLELR